MNKPFVVGFDRDRAEGIVRGPWAAWAVRCIVHPVPGGLSVSFRRGVGMESSCYQVTVSGAQSADEAAQQVWDEIHAQPGGLASVLPDRSQFDFHSMLDSR